MLNGSHVGKKRWMIQWMFRGHRELWKKQSSDTRQDMQQKTGRNSDLLLWFADDDDDDDADDDDDDDDEKNQAGRAGLL